MWVDHLILRSRLEELREDVSEFLEIADLVLRDLCRGCSYSRFYQMGGGPTHLGRTGCIDSRVICNRR
jgi:hypothetical protein